MPVCPLAFHREYVAPNRPVIIQGLSRNWKASGRWNLDYLRQILRDDICQISVGRLNCFVSQLLTIFQLVPDGLADAVVDGKFQLPEERKVEFSFFADVIEGKRQPEDGGIYYLQRQNSCLTEDYPKLAKDVPDEIEFATAAFEFRDHFLNFDLRKVWVNFYDPNYQERLLMQSTSG